MSEEVKLIIAEQLNGSKHEFMIYSNQIVGEGGFGVVKKATETERPEKSLVVKIIPYGDQKKREKIQKQLNIIRTLPQHRNLVDVRPLKCFSSKNYYIFMEYCKDGTLEDLLKKSKGFSEEEVLDFFWQFMKGYQVLYERKILHQDIKPDNVLIKGHTYKLTDFGFSIFHEGHKYSSIRQGTLPYMPLEKLTERDFYANTKIDVYALGIILFKMIIGHHPWVRYKVKDHKEYLKALKNNKLSLNPEAHHSFSIKFQHFFDFVLRMIAKHEKNRIDFDQLYEYLETEQIFEKMRGQGKEKSEVINLQEHKKLLITQQSEAIAIPFGIHESEEEDFKNKAHETLKEKKFQAQLQTCTKIQNYIVRHRIIVYFFDRLTRRIYVQKLKKKSVFSSGQEKVILALLLLCKKIVQSVLRQSKSPSAFKLEEWRVYRKSENSLIKVIQKDQSYLEDLVIDCLSESAQVKIQEQKALLDLSNQSLVKYIQMVQELMEEFLKSRLRLMKPENKSSMVTVKYILNGLDILKNYQKWVEEALELEKYFRYVQTLEMEELLDKLFEELTAMNIQFSFDLGEVNSEGVPLMGKGEMRQQ